MTIRFNNDNQQHTENKEQRATSPTPPPPPPAPPAKSSPPSTSQRNEPKSGVLLIRVCDAQGLTLPEGIDNKATTPARSAASNNRDSLTRKQNWWLPYVVLEFDRNELLVDALGGDATNPIYQYRAHL